MMSCLFIFLYGLEEESVDYVKKLFFFGVVILGKIKMMQFVFFDEFMD